MKIHSLSLPSTNIDSMREFYTSVLGLKLAESDSQFFTLQAGFTRMAFNTINDGTLPKHHFAFNIPPNLFQEAKTWLAERTGLISGKEGQVEFDFSNWNALGMYFIDPAGNIGELIARDMLPSAQADVFSADHILSVSEIGVPVPDVPGTVDLLRRAAGLQPYRGETDTFTAVGDENGLLIVVQQGREWYPRTGISAQPSPLEIWFENNHKRFHLQLVDAGVSIQVE